MDAKRATAQAVAHMNDLLGDSVRDLRLEEVEHTGAVWKITVSWEERGRPRGVLAEMNGAPREYKVVTIDDASGQMLSLRMRSA